MNEGKKTREWLYINRPKLLEIPGMEKLRGHYLPMCIAMVILGVQSSSGFTTMSVKRLASIFKNTPKWRFEEALGKLIKWEIVGKKENGCLYVKGIPDYDWSQKQPKEESKSKSKTTETGELARTAEYYAWLNQYEECEECEECKEEIPDEDY